MIIKNKSFYDVNGNVNQDTLIDPIELDPTTLYKNLNVKYYVRRDVHWIMIKVYERNPDGMPENLVYEQQVENP